MTDPDDIAATLAAEPMGALYAVEGGAVDEAGTLLRPVREGRRLVLRRYVLVEPGGPVIELPPEASR